MMKLRHLFHNPDLAEMLLKNWDYDETSLEMFQYYRISANAIYPFRQKGGICFLRFCPASEKRKETIEAELEFIGYLRGAGYPAAEPLPSKTGANLVQKSTPWGEYYACVFKRVSGQPISETSCEDEVMFAYGAALGLLHKLSSENTAPKIKRWTYEDVFNWIEETLSCLPGGTSPLDELRLLRDYFSRRPTNGGRYGLIHYDFELDNVFYDHATKSCSVIDFDDAMVHWYGMDIDQALDSLQSEIAEDQFPRAKAVFIEGYRSQYGIDDDLFAAMPLFRRFAMLYRYTRITRSIQERWENEPEWLAGLRTKLTGALASASEHFGKAIQAVP